MVTIVCVAGDKGGTGKSTWARGLADLYRMHDCQAALFDGDWLARSLFKVFRAVGAHGQPEAPQHQNPRSGCLPYDIRDRRMGRDALLNSLSLKDTDIVLHDLPAGFRADIALLMGITNHQDALREFAAAVVMLGHQLVFVNVMTPSPSDFHTAPWLATTLAPQGPNVRVIAVRNGLFEPEAYGLWEREAVRTFRNAGGIEIAMPRLDATAAIMCDHLALRFSKALLDERLSLAERLRIISWLRRFGESLNPVCTFLGLPADIGQLTAIKLKYQPNSTGRSNTPPPAPTAPIPAGSAGVGAEPGSGDDIQGGMPVAAVLPLPSATPLPSAVAVDKPATIKELMKNGPMTGGPINPAALAATAPAKVKGPRKPRKVLQDGPVAASASPPEPAQSPPGPVPSVPSAPPPVAVKPPPPAAQANVPKEAAVENDDRFLLPVDLPII